MLGVKVELKDAEKVKEFLMEKEAIDTDFRYDKTDTHMYFPVSCSKEFLKALKNVEFVEMDFELKEFVSGKDIKSMLSEKLSDEELSNLKSAHDIIGTIAILEIDEELRDKENIIADAVLMTNKNIQTVLRKDGGHEGNFRVQKMKWLAGVKTKETIHIENGTRLKLNVETVYFSPRLSTERKRITELVKPNEKILVMFSGCAPYPCVISKNTEAQNIIGIEINPEGHKYGLENIELNKLKNVELINADVKIAVPKLAEKNLVFDRIVMPAPHNADSFIKEAILVSKKGTIIHFYDFLHEDKFLEAEKKVDEACKSLKKKWKKISLNKCGQHAPHIFRICLDFEIL